MGGLAFVVTPSDLANEIIEIYQQAAPPFPGYKVFFIGSPPAVDLPDGSVITSKPSLAQFDRFLVDNDIDQLVFVANIIASFNLWLQVILRTGIPQSALRLNPTASDLLNRLSRELEARNIEIVHPHRISDSFRLKRDEQISCGRPNIANAVRLWLIHRPIRQTLRTVPEGRLLALLDGVKIKLIASETTNTKDLILRLEQVAPAEKSTYRRIILSKTKHDPTSITYSVIGTSTLLDAASHGITDIMIGEDCVIQGKRTVLELAQKHNISITLA